MPMQAQIKYGQDDKIVMGPRWAPVTRTDWLTVGRKLTSTSTTITQTGHNIRVIMKDYWSIFLTVLYTILQRHEKMQPVFHILRFIQFCNVTQPEETDKNYSKLQKIVFL
jgi:hypothetical protein